MLKKDIIVQISPEHLFIAFSKQLKTGASLPLTHSILSPEEEEVKIEIIRFWNE